GPASIGLLPRRLRHDRRAHAILLRRDTVEIVALPLPDRPDAFVEIVLELDFADYGFERAGIDLPDDRRAVDLADALDRLLQHLQAGVSDRARPAVGLTADDLLVVLDVPLDAGQIGIRAANAHHAFGARAKLALVDRKRRADADVEHLRRKARDL